MLKTIIIKDKDSDQVVGEFEIDIEYQNANLHANDFYDEAWKNAIEDGLVNKEEKYKYRISFKE